jgi:TetR/AcrR family transcriptional regulator, repressor for neighboring sulfatase
MSDDQDKRPRASREETTEAILDAAEALFAERGYTAVTVREIAAMVGVSHALIHRYLGSKAAIYATVLRRHELVIRASAPDSDDLLESTSLMLREAWLKQGRYLRLIAHSALHGLSYNRTSGRFAATERLVELGEKAAAAGAEDRDPDAPSPRFVIASLVAMLLGWAAAKDWVLPAAGIDEMSDEEFLAAFEHVLRDIERLYFPAAGDAGAE